MIGEKYQSRSPAQTKDIGRQLAEYIIRNIAFQNQALVLALFGDLGGGKTTFLQGFAEGLGIKQRILSPTFVIVKKYPLVGLSDKKGKEIKFLTFYHIDCYRVDDSKEILDLGFKEIVSSPQNLIAIEWANRVKELVPPQSLKVEFSIPNGKKREIIIQWKK